MDLKNLDKYFIPCAEQETGKTDKEICKRCGGKCCMNMGCHISPFDLKEISKEFIISLIDETGIVSIDWYEGNLIDGRDDGTKSFYLRMRNKDAKVIDGAIFGTSCGILTETGCPIEFRYRPKGARELIPAENREAQCEALYSKTQCAIDWWPYHDIMLEVYRHYKKKGEFTQNPILDAIAMLRCELGIQEDE